MSAAEDWAGPLPDPVRARVVVLAADTLGALGEDEVPASLRRFRGWAPQHRRTRAATPLAAAVERDVTFRQRVAALGRERQPELAEALDAGISLPAADPLEVAALAYLVRPAQWVALLAAAQAAAERASAAAAQTRAAEDVARRGAVEDAERSRHRAQIAGLRAELAGARVELDAATKALREEKGARRRAERRAVESADAAAATSKEAAAAESAAAEQVRQAGEAAKGAVAALEAARRASREGRSLADSKLRLLMDVLVDAAAGLRRELALPPLTARPADFVEAVAPGESGRSDRAYLVDDPALLDQLVTLPQAHLVVDGYNVTKSGFPDLSLEDQRSRLLGGLASLAARSGAEVTCCFDGAALEGRVPAASARGVRVLFSRAGETADELIRRLVRAEPAGRPVTVVSSDREVAEGVRRSGAHSVAAAALVRRLERS